MKPLLVPFTKKNPPKSRMILGPWRSDKAVKKSAEARKTIKMEEK